MKARLSFWAHMGTVVLAVGAFGLLLAGCGGDEPTATPSPTPTQPGAEPTPTLDPEAAFQAEWDALIEAAQAEGKLIVEATGGAGRRYRPVSDFFAEKFGIDVTFATGSDIPERIMAERQAGKYLVDITFMSQSSPLRLLIPGGALASLPELLIHPEVTDKSLWLGGRHYYGDPDERYIFLFAGSARVTPITFYYNSDLLSPDDVEALKTIWDFVKTDPKPSWAGQVVASPPSEQASQYASAYAHPDLGAEWVQAFIENPDINWLTDDRLLVDGLARGQYALAIFVSGSARNDLDELGEKGQPVAAFTNALNERPTVGPAGSSSAIHQLDRAPNAAAAQLFLNWWLTIEGQTIRHELSDSPPPVSLREDVPFGITKEEDRRKPGVDYFVTGGSRELEVLKQEGRVFADEIWQGLRR